MATSKILWHGEDNFAGDSERINKERKTEKRDGKITSKNGQDWSLEIPRGQRKTGKGGTVMLQHRLWCSDDRQG